MWSVIALVLGLKAISHVVDTNSAHTPTWQFLTPPTTPLMIIIDLEYAMYITYKK